MPASLQWWNTLEAIGLFVIWAAGVWMVVSNAWWRKAIGDVVPEADIKPTPIGTVEEYPEGLAEAHGSPPLALKIFIVLWVFWTIGYVALYFMG